MYKLLLCLFSIFALFSCLSENQRLGLNPEIKREDYEFINAYIKGEHLVKANVLSQDQTQFVDTFKRPPSQFLLVEGYYQAGKYGQACLCLYDEKTKQILWREVEALNFPNNPDWHSATPPEDLNNKIRKQLLFEINQADENLELWFWPYCPRHREQVVYPSVLALSLGKAKDLGFKSDLD